MTNLDSNQRVLYPTAQIKEGTRIRTDYGDVAGLADSIRENGLIHPIVINTAGVLIAGGRRFRAMRDILRWTEVPITYFEFADEATLRILEREENVRRKAMSWQEEALAISEVHAHHSLNAALDPNKENWTTRATGELLGMSKANVSYTLQLADKIKTGDKDILACPRMWDAIHLLTKRRAEESTKIVARLTIPKLDLDAARASLSTTDLDAANSLFAPVGPSSGGVTTLADDGEMPNVEAPKKLVISLSNMLLKGDCIDLLERIPNESIDHCITDWPYAIDIDMLNQNNQHGGMKDVDMVKAEHDVMENQALHKVIVPLIYAKLKPSGFFITFIDYMQWQTTYDLCTKAGFKVQRWPIEWNKTHRCMNQAALYNFTKSTEPAIVCRKGNATLINPQPVSVWPGSNEAEVASLGHPFAKPFKLWEWLYSAVCIRGQTVLDPFAGRGSSTIAALQFGLSPLAIEKQDAHHNALIVNVAEYYKKTLKNVEFV